MTINVSKIAMIFAFCIFAHLYGSLFVCGMAYINPFSVDSYVHSPYVISFVPINSGITALIVALGCAIAHVLRMVSNSEVTASIVETISIPMITLYFGVSETQNEAMHQGSSVRGSCVERMRRLAPLGVPVERIYPFIIDSVYYRYLTFGQGNVFDRLILRLNNRWAINRVLTAFRTFDHESTSNGFAAFSRFSIVSIFVGS